MGFFSLSSAWLFALLLPLIVFYFLKLRRPRVELPSLALWRSVLNDQRVNSPFQRFRRNLLLLLQILLLTLLCLSAMQPYLTAGPQRLKYLPVLIDVSASMAAKDAAGRGTRLDAARGQLRELIDNMLPDQFVSLVSFSSSPQRLTDFTDNRQILREALDKLTVTDLPSRTDDALRLAQAMSRVAPADSPVEQVLMFTDGNIPDASEFDQPISFNLKVQLTPPAGPNIGITALNARRTKDRKWELFARIEAGQGGAQKPVALKPADGKVAEESVGRGG